MLFSCSLSGGGGSVDGSNGATEYTVTYASNGASSGDVPVDSRQYTQGATVTVLGNTKGLSKMNWTFAGWSADEAGAGSAYSAGDTFRMGTRDVTLYAQWSAWLSYVTAWGSAGTGDGQFGLNPGFAQEGPLSIAADPVGCIYVVDTMNCRIEKFDSSGNFLLKWGSAGSTNGKFSLPTRVCADGAGNIYVLDVGTDLVQKFDSAGTFIAKIGGPGTGNGQFSFGGNDGAGVAVDSSGNVYVLDDGNSRVEKFTTTNGTTYTCAATWGSHGSANGQLSIGSQANLVVDGSGTVYVADPGNHRIVTFSSTGTFLSNIDLAGKYEAYFTIAMDPANQRLYVLDVYGCTIHRFALDGTYVSSWSNRGTGTGQILYPNSFTYSRGYLYVLDFNVVLATTGNNRIEKYQVY